MGTAIVVRSALVAQIFQGFSLWGGLKASFCWSFFIKYRGVNLSLLFFRFAEDFMLPPLVLIIHNEQSCKIQADSPPVYLPAYNPQNGDESNNDSPSAVPPPPKKSLATFSDTSPGFLCILMLVLSALQAGQWSWESQRWITSPACRGGMYFVMTTGFVLASVSASYTWIPCAAQFKLLDQC